MGGMVTSCPVGTLFSSPDRSNVCSLSPLEALRCDLPNRATTLPDTLPNVLDVNVGTYRGIMARPPLPTIPRPSNVCSTRAWGAGAANRTCVRSPFPSLTITDKVSNPRNPTNPKVESHMTITDHPTETVAETLPERPDFEAIRVSIITRTSTGFTDPSYAACKHKSGEILKSASHSETQAVLVFETKYGKTPGYRTVVLTAPDKATKLALVADAFAEKPAVPKEKLARIKLANWTSVIDHEPIQVPIDFTPADGIASEMSYTFHVRSLGDRHVICSTTNLQDAKRIVAALGNCAVFQFRNSRTYDDTTTWMVA